MAARKRKAPSKPVAPANKKVRIGDSSITEEPEQNLSTRPRRKSAGTPQYNFTRPHRSVKKLADLGTVALTAVAPDPPKRRGRPPKEPTAPVAAPAKLNAVSSARGRGRGRPSNKTIAEESGLQQATSEKRRGRPPKSPANKVAQTTSKGTDLPRKRGRPRISKPLGAAAPPNRHLPEDALDTDNYGDEDSQDDHDEHQYWLMKAEPNDRFENGVNVKFSIDDLAAAEEPEPWDGVRNYGARNNMRAMRKGDLAFFYHSNCPVPGIVGVMRIVHEHTPDQSAFDPKHPYYDPKSEPSNPKWDCVHVEFVKKFESPVSLKMLQENKKSSGELENMQLLRMSRLSVSGVSPEEWRVVLKMADEDLHVGENGGTAGGTAPLTDGYESDTDGEVNTGPKEELNGDIAAATKEEESE